jgi:hypothetical protein
VATFIAKMITLTYGPGQINILGLYVALLAASPFLLLPLRTGHTPLVLAASWGAYLVNAALPTRVLPFQSENSFPVLAWQLLFVHGVVIGYHRDRILASFSGRFGGPLRVAVVGSALVLCFFALNNPWHDVPGPTRFSLIPEPMYYSIYQRFFQRTQLGLGRFLNTLVAAGALYMLLGWSWTASRRLLGWLCIPIGRASLYVFVVHLIFVQAVCNTPLLQRNLVGVNTVAHTAVILAIWAMVRNRIFFRWIPR